MKKILFAVLLAPLSGYGQYTLEAQFDRSISVVNFSSTTPKIMEVVPGIAHIIKLYDAPNSLWKNISIPLLFPYEVYSVSSVSDHLFNSDDLVEYGVVYKKTGENVYVFKVFQEGATSPLLVVEDAITGYPLLVDENGTYKLSVGKYVQGAFSGTSLYSLPGELPCTSCSGLKVGRVNKPEPFFSEAIPNPSAGSFSFQYQIPGPGVLTVTDMAGRVVGVYPVSDLQSSVQLELKQAAGTYVCTLSGDGFATTSRKVLLK